MALCEHGVAVHRLQPLQSSHYMRSLRMYAKTDILDAMALARYGAERHSHLAVFKPDDASTQELKILQTRRDDLIAMRVAENQRLKHPLYQNLHVSLRTVLSVIETEIDTIESRMQEIVAENAHLSWKMQILCGFKGIGSVTALVLLAAMPEIGTLDRKQIAALAGLAPHPKDSGKYTGYRATKGGRSSARKALFMAALSAKRYDPILKDFFDRLIKNGKKPIVALVAVMRKMIIIINAQIRDNLFA
jgi:transposase